MNLLVVMGQTFEIRNQLADAGLEWDGVNQIYAMYVHDGNQGDVNAIVQFLGSCQGVRHEIMPEARYRELAVPAAPKARAKQGNGGGAGKPQANGQVAGHFAQAAQQTIKDAFAQENKDVVEWLAGYSGDFHVYLSVRQQYNAKGSLSPKQVEMIRRAIQRDVLYAAQQAAREQRLAVEAAAYQTNEIPAQPMDQSKATYAPGTVVQVKAWFANKMKDEVGLSHVHRNIEILETLRESDRAIQVRIRFTPRYSTCCSICGRKLDNQVSRATGIGPVCADKVGIERYSVENARDVIQQLEVKLGAIGEKVIWIPRTQIKGIVPAAAEQAA